MVLTGSCPWPRSWLRSYGAHLHLQAREDPLPTAGTVPSTFMSEKTIFRKEAREHRAALARAMPDFAARIAAKFMLASGSLVGGYRALRDEADPHALLERLAGNGCELCLPRLAERDAPLWFHRWAPGQILVKGAFGVEEALPDWPRVWPTIVLVPLLAFDAFGYRLGYGGGYYDRTLAALGERGPVTAIGVAFAGQEVSALPVEEHDRPLDMVLTEEGVRRFT